MNDLVYIIILNYKGWEDTIECIESILKSDFSIYKIIVVDNDSPNESVNNLKAWANGDLNLFLNEKNPLKGLSFPFSPKPIPYLAIKSSDIDSMELKNINCCNLIFIESDKNLGFAGGNNLGIKLAKRLNNFEYVWLLNNDTVIKKNSLSQLVAQGKSDKNSNYSIGLYGSKLLYYYNPTKIQAVGGKYNKWFGVPYHVGSNKENSEKYNDSSLKLDYVVGASLFVTKEFIQKVGLLNEEYFLYFEELDWILRGKAQGFKFIYNYKSEVFHKEGATIGESNKIKKSEVAEYYSLKNRIIFSKKYFPQYLPIVYLGFFFVALNRLKRGQFSKIFTIFKILFKE